MAYGQTGTGKTHTLGARGYDDPSERGIIHRAVEAVMEASDAGYAAGGLRGINVTVQYMQVYQDNVFDLLGGGDVAEPLGLAEEAGGDIRVSGAREVDVSCTAEVMQLLDDGESARAVANHRLNASSSRSHAILILRVANAKGKAGGSSGNSSGKMIRGKLMLVDLAGSERTAKTGSEGITQKEAQAINKSLTALGRCIQVLAAGAGGHVPYRDSKLTRLLSDSLGGSALTSLIATVGPLREHYSETAATLKFGQQALRVENTLKVKEGVDYKLLCRRLQSEVEAGIAENERMKKMTREAEARAADAAARMRVMALAEVELSVAKKGAEREAKLARAESDMAKAEAEAAESKAAVEADAGNATAAYKAQVDSERVRWHQEKSEMLAMNTSLGDQLEGVLELLKTLDRQYAEDFNYRSSLEARENDVALLEQQVAQHQRQQYDQLQQDTGDTGRRQGTSAISDDGGGGGGGGSY
uniref:Kinesin-like protein n=1 Tax=Mantoniella antarctica TaxID=81844 RepID=A0A7S0XB73_9CHLO